MSDLPEDVAGENLDNAFREFDELLERWDNRLSVENLALAERYRKAECKLGLILKNRARREVVGNTALRRRF